MSDPESDLYGPDVDHEQLLPGVARIFGTCSEHGEYELPLAAIERGDVERRCPACIVEVLEWTT